MTPTSTLPFWLCRCIARSEACKHFLVRTVNTKNKWYFLDARKYLPEKKKKKNTRKVYAYMYASTPFVILWELNKYTLAMYEEQNVIFFLNLLRGISKDKLPFTIFLYRVPESNLMYKSKAKKSHALLRKMSSEKGRKMLILYVRQYNVYQKRAIHILQANMNVWCREHLFPRRRWKKHTHTNKHADTRTIQAAPLHTFGGYNNNLCVRVFLLVCDQQRIAYDCQYASAFPHCWKECVDELCMHTLCVFVVHTYATRRFRQFICSHMWMHSQS